MNLCSIWITDTNIIAGHMNHLDIRSCIKFYVVIQALYVIMGHSSGGNTAIVNRENFMRITYTHKQTYISLIEMRKTNFGDKKEKFHHANKWTRIERTIKNQCTTHTHIYRNKHFFTSNFYVKTKEIHTFLFRKTPIRETLFKSTRLDRRLASFFQE